MKRCRRTAHRGLFIALAAIACLFAIIPVDAHKDKPHKDTTLETDTTTQASIDSARLAIDSIYTVIQEGYRVVQGLFRRACYDCHSNQTHYPWYYKLPIVRGLIDSDIAEARKHLDMSEGFPFAGHGNPVEDLTAIKRVLEEGAMPPFRYRILHWKTAFSDGEIDSVFGWIDRSLKLMTSHVQPPTMYKQTDSSEAPLQGNQYPFEHK